MVKRGDMMSLEDVCEVLAIELLGAVPDDEAIVVSTNRGEPLVGKMCIRDRLRHETKEVLLVSLFTGKGRLITEQVVSVGSINSSVVSPREIFYTAIIHNAAYLILLHNHPSGDPTPSEQDFKVTEHLKICGKYMDIQLADHIIIGDNQYYSFRENGRL